MIQKKLKKRAFIYKTFSMRFLQTYHNNYKRDFRLRENFFFPKDVISSEALFIVKSVFKKKL